jgi:hypothetical protein
MHQVAYGSETSMGTALTDAERQEDEGLVDLAELLSLLRMRSERMNT